MRTPLVSLSIVGLIASVNLAAEGWQLRGRVVDEAGRPVAGASVDHCWRANGTQKRPDGSRLDFTKEDDVRTVWSHEGRMEPMEGAKTGPDGTFVLQVSRRRHKVMALDAARQRGGIAIIDNGQDDEPVTIRLTPLVKVSGRFELAGSGKKPDFTMARVMVSEDPSRPLDNFWVAQCGSLESRFEFSLPPGKYVLETLGAPGVDDVADHTVTPNPELIVTGKSREQDLGLFRLEKPPPTVREKQIAKADADGSWGDYKKHYGQPPPKWHVLDARGVTKGVQLADFRGKWVLAYFWGLSCPHCLGDDLPRLMKFYEDYRGERDRFEIIAFCTEADQDLQSIADLDKALAPIVKHVWNGKTLPFPVLLDPTFTTMQRYGFRRYGTLLLIDPSGNLVEGDEKTLAERLQQ